MDYKSFLNYVETRGQAGYGSAILVKNEGDTKYSLLIASETAPSVYGTPNSFEFDLINSSVLGKIQGKESMEDKDVEFLLHRDNIYRLEQLKGKILDFLYVTPDLMGWKFVGRISARPNDAGSDVLRGTYTISPMSSDKEPIMDVRPLIKDTVLFAETVPASLSVNVTGEKVEFVTSPADAVVNVVIKNGDKTTDYFTYTDGTFKAKTAYTNGEHKYAIAYCTATKEGYAPWTTTIALSDK